jgi:transposase InsO family protein
MNTQSKMQTLLLAAATALGLAVGLALPAFAQEQPPQPMHQGDVTYVTGGVGEGARAALETTAKDYNLRITNADKKSEMTGMDSLVIKDGKGTAILTLQNGDPILYAKLPAGTYTVEAKNGSESKIEKVTIGAEKASDIHFIW